jgi:hypothetical protein
VKLTKTPGSLGYFGYLRSSILSLAHISLSFKPSTFIMPKCHFCGEECEGCVVYCCGLSAHVHCRNSHLGTGSRLCPVCFTSWVEFIPDLTPPASPQPGGSGACNDETRETCMVCLEPCSEDDRLECCPQYMHLRCIFETILKTDSKKCPHCRQCWRHYMRQSMQFEVSTNFITHVLIYFYLFK